MLAFSLNAATNVLLISYLARLGGLELVGTWVLLNAVLMVTLILDLGVTNTLSLCVGRDGVAATAPLLKRASRNGFWLATACLAAGVGLWAVAQDHLLPFVIVALAAVLQLSSNWRIAIRTGQHQQYYFNIKTIVRVLAQAVFAMVLLAFLPDDPELALAVALLIGGLLEVGFTQMATIRALSGNVLPAATSRDLIRANTGFGSTSTFIRAFQPVSTLIITGLLDQVAAAVFNVALRIPVVISQSISEALRGLLPGLAALKASAPDRIEAMLRDALISQIALIVPAVIFVLFHAELLLQVWLGDVPEGLSTALRMLLVSVVFTAIATPFHWANFALGWQKAASRVYITGIAGVFVVGALGLVLSGDVLVFVGVYALAQIGMASGMLWIAQAKGAYISRSLAQIRWLRLGLLIFSAILLNLALELIKIMRVVGDATLFLMVVISLIACTGFSLRVLRKWSLVN